MNIQYEDTRKSDMKYIIAAIIIAIAIAFCSLSGNIGVRLHPELVKTECSSTMYDFQMCNSDVFGSK